jgi:hypothetical protein
MRCDREDSSRRARFTRDRWIVDASQRSIRTATTARALHKGKSSRQPPNNPKELTMKTLTTNVLANVSGGASKSSELTTALSSIQSSIKDVANQKNNSGGLGDSSTMLMLGLMMSQKNQGPTVVAAGPAAAPASGPVVNISTRVRRGW